MLLFCNLPDPNMQIDDPKFARDPAVGNHQINPCILGSQLRPSCVHLSPNINPLTVVSYP